MLDGVAASCEGGGVVEGEAQLKQVDASGASFVQLNKQVLHEGQFVGHHGHLHHGGVEHAHATFQRVERALPQGGRLLRLDAETHLVEACFAQLVCRLRVHALAAGVQARVCVGVQLAGTLEEREELALVQERLAARHGQMLQAHAVGMLGLKVSGYVAHVRLVVGVVLLVGVEAEEALFGALGGGEERLRAHGLAAGQTRGRDPVEPQAAAGVFHMEARPRHLVHLGREGTETRLLLRGYIQAKLPHRLEKVGTNLAVGLRIVACVLRHGAHAGFTARCVQGLVDCAEQHVMILQKQCYTSNDASWVARLAARLPHGQTARGPRRHLAAPGASLDFRGAVISQTSRRRA